MQRPQFNVRVDPIVAKKIRILSAIEGLPIGQFIERELSQRLNQVDLNALAKGRSEQPKQ